MVVINKHPQAHVVIYEPTHKIIGTVENGEEFADVRAQIAEQFLDGYYILYKDTRYNIEPTGRLKIWPDGLYDGEMEQTARIFRTTKK